METVWDWEFRLYPALLVGVAGMATALRGDVLLFRGLHLPIGTPFKNLVAIRGLRLVLLGLSVAAVAAGWVLHWPAMVAAGACIGFEETLETSIVAWALAREETA
jgi:hypothetical protein